MKPVVRMQVFALVLIIIISLFAPAFAAFGTGNSDNSKRAEMPAGTEFAIVLVLSAAVVSLGASIMSDVGLLLWYEGKKKGRLL